MPLASPFEICLIEAGLQTLHWAPQKAGLILFRAQAPYETMKFRLRKPAPGNLVSIEYKKSVGASRDSAANPQAITNCWSVRLYLIREPVTKLAYASHAPSRLEWSDLAEVSELSGLARVGDPHVGG